MSRKEPYIGMPIDLEDWGNTETVPNIRDEYMTQDIPSISNFENFKIAMAYVPWQRWRDAFGYEEAFRAGTLFKELDLPFRGRRGGMAR